MDQGWKSYKGVRTLVGNISIASKVKQEEAATKPGVPSRFVRNGWTSVQHSSRLVAFMRSLKSGQDLSGLGYKSDRSKTFCETLKKFANEHLAKLAAGKFNSPEALLGRVCGGAPDGNTMKALFETFFAGIKMLNAAKKCCGILQPTACRSCLRRARRARPFPVPAGMNTLYSLNTKLER